MKIQQLTKMMSGVECIVGGDVILQTNYTERSKYFLKPLFTQPVQAHYIGITPRHYNTIKEPYNLLCLMLNDYRNTFIPLDDPRAIINTYLIAAVNISKEQIDYLTPYIAQGLGFTMMNDILVAKNLTLYYGQPRYWTMNKSYNTFKYDKNRRTQ